MPSDVPIAIIGSAYRAPGVGRKDLWEFLAEARSAWSTVPTDRFQQSAFQHGDSGKPGFFSSAGAHFLPDDIYAFDPAFFNLTADEARAMDPQHRMLMECALEACEGAGLTLNDIADSQTGVFAALAQPEYGYQAAEDLPASNKFTATGIATTMFANRMSYWFNLKGPSITVDAACASGSYALHLACQSIRAGECKTTFVGGCSLIVSPVTWVLLDTLGALSPQGKCFSYDKKAAGFGRGEGGGCIILKRLSDALADGDPIRAVIRNTAAGHDGKTDGISLPSRIAQADLLRKVHAEVGLSPADTQLVEGHGTGTAVGDPIEASAIASVFGQDRTAEDPVYIGSLKSNFGHMEGASGILATIKAMMMVEQGHMLPNASFEEINPAIAEKEKLRVLKKITPWPADGRPRRVCVSNFGFGGSNAVALLEQPPTSKQSASSAVSYSNGHTPNGFTNGFTPTTMNGHANESTNGVSNGITNGLNDGHVNGYHQDENDPLRLFAFSAKSDTSLSSYLTTLTTWLDKFDESTESFSDLSFTLGCRRNHFPYRFAAVADSLSALKEQISSFSKSSRSRQPSFAFVFTGQGAQYAGMATELYCYPLFRDTIMESEHCLRKFGAAWSLTDELKRDETNSRINDAEISQPACTAVQIALVRLFRQWEIQPAIVTGHSSGEIASAYAAGVLNLETAMAIAFFRGQAAAKVTNDATFKGAMLALGTGADEAEALIQQHENIGYATVAAINSPGSVTVSGDEEAINSIHKAAEEQSIFVRRLKVNVAYHSRHMEKVAASYLADINPWFTHTTNIETHNVKYISSVTGRIEVAKALGPGYWISNLLQPVRFMDALAAIASDEDMTPTIIFEIGPHAALKNPIKQTLEYCRTKLGKAQVSNMTYLPSLMRGTPADRAALASAASIYALGAIVDFAAVNNFTAIKERRVLTNLPAYEWNKSVSYIEQHRITKHKQQPGHAYHPLLGWKSPYSEGRDHSFRQIFSLDEMPWIRDHNIAYATVFPMAGYLCLAAAAVKALHGTACAVTVRDFHAKRGLTIDEDERVEVTTKLSPAATGTENFSAVSWTFEIASWTEARGWITHCYGTIEKDPYEDISQSPALTSRAGLVTKSNFYQRNALEEYSLLAKNGMRYEGKFKTMDTLQTAPGITVMETQAVRLGSSFTDVSVIDPPMLDAFMHCAPITVEMKGEEGIRHTYMPVSFSSLRLPASLPTFENHRFTTIMELLERDEKTGDFSTRLSVYRHDEHSQLQPVVQWDSVRFKAVSRHESLTSHIGPLPNSYDLEFVPCIEFWDAARVQQRLMVEPATDEESKIMRLSIQVAYYYMTRILREIADKELLIPESSHLSKAIAWFRRIVVGQDILSEADAQQKIAELSGSGAQGEMLCRVGEHLPQLLRNEVQPLEIMLRDGLLSRNYEEDRCVRRANRALGRYVRQMVKANPFLRILEIGAGTASSTAAIFEELEQDGGPELYPHINYTFTDISSGFFENARAKLSTWSEQLTFKKLDITRDPLSEQGFSAGSFDLIVAGNVLHATPSMLETLRNTRSLLSSGGQLALVEFTSNLPFHLPWSTLPGWWVGEDDYRSPDGPLLSEASWDRALRDTGFSGTEMVAQADTGSGEHFMAIISSTVAVPAPLTAATNKAFQSVTIWSQFIDAETTAFAQTLAHELNAKHGYQCTIRGVLEVENVDEESLSQQTWNIVVDESSQSIFENITKSKFGHIHKLLAFSGGIFWIIPRQHIPDSATIKGMFRAMRQEDQSRLFISLEGVVMDQVGTDTVVQLLPKLDAKPESQRCDQEFVINAVTNEVEVPRLRLIKDAKIPFLCDVGAPPREEQVLLQAAGADALELTIDAAGSPDSIYFRRSDILSAPLPGNDIIVRVDAAGVNFRDLLLVLGTIPWMPPGFEGAGVVERIGNDVNNVAVGDRVFFIAGSGAFATHVKISSSWSCKIPESISSTDAASLPLAYSTAFMALRQTAKLQKGESVLIHAASGAVGQACIAVAQAEGARIFATAGSPEKRDFLHEVLGVPVANIFSSRTPDFKEAILSATAGHGVDVVINSLSGPLLRETWSLVAEFGRFVELGRKDFLENSHLAMKQFDRNITFNGIDLQKYFTKRPEIVPACFTQLVEGLASGVVKPIQPVTQIPVSDIARALRKLQSGTNIGKLVVTMGEHDRILAEKESPLGGPSAQILKKDATYLITGGTGGIGRSLACWMFEQGASNVVLLGRSGSSRPEVARLVEKYNNTDKCLRAVACDVGSRDDLKAALESIRDLPKVQGIVHGALYLRDSLFVNATIEHWTESTDPKIRAAWHLHDMCPDLDFFVSLGSIAGETGHVGQSLYAGTTTFLDAFTEYRLSRGLPAANISLPIVLDVGYAADTGLQSGLVDLAGLTLTESQVHTTVKAAIIGESSGLLSRGKALVFILGNVTLSPTSFEVPLSLAALHRRHKSGGDNTGALDVESGRTRDLPTLLDALMHKVASMMLMDLEEVEADQPLSIYGLDSLVSVELRNWIRKETGVDIALARIVGAKNLQELAETIWSLM